MMEQYFEIKNQYKDYLLFYRLGDFYEMFFDDAIKASRELELTLTGRDCGEAERAPMCGVPFHSAEKYISTLIDRGYKVAICEQMEDPSKAKGLVKRDIVRIITPGTLLEPEMLTEKRNNYVAALALGDAAIGLCFADVSTAEVYATEITGGNMSARLFSELGTYAPSEVILDVRREDAGELSDFLLNRVGAMLSDGEGARFEYSAAYARVAGQFGEESAKGIADSVATVSAIGALLDYIADMQRSDISYINRLHIYTDGQYMDMDINTRRNLELTETMRSKEKRGTLLWVLDRTHTAPGARLLRSYVEHPLLSSRAIATRQRAVGELLESFILREELGAALSGVLDLERLITRIVYGTANAKDLRAVANTVAVLPEVKRLLSECRDEELCRIREELDDLADIHSLIDAAIADEPPFVLREGGLIKGGYHADVDYLREVMKDGKAWIERVANEERERTGIRTLKIGYNKVFGYYIEVSRSFVDQVPDTYIRKQTLTNGERYITEELKDMEATILGAADKVCTLEYEIFQDIRARVAAAGERIQRVANRLAELDVYLSFADVAAKNKYVCPTVDHGSEIRIKDGRHPVVEQFVKDTYFVPNDALLDTEDNRIMLITGPNMAGKSTYMRQVALIVLMAQIGSFVPAAQARIGIVDKLFTRVGASDDLASGQSTFMLEMNEVAYILKNATRRSLIIYDEVGRGTSTFDGMSIARAIIEYTNSRRIGAKTLFATHYHELTSLEAELRGVVNYNIAAKKKGDTITFLRKIVRGSTDDSYGIEVAKLAGVPSEVIRRAKEVLAEVEDTARLLRAPSADIERTVDDAVITIEDCANEQVIEELKRVDLNTLSPYEAMAFLFDLKKRLELQ
ncbi:MAG: DNA mismatch repair protein MutS [Ruminococcaceae bacterium]|nr:DNA mismatch repair protein MutS [Oscillospiraceae bacterium]